MKHNRITITLCLALIGVTFSRLWQPSYRALFHRITVVGIFDGIYSGGQRHGFCHAPSCLAMARALYPGRCYPTDNLPKGLRWEM
jgi:hypothetical protein